MRVFHQRLHIGKVRAREIIKRLSESLRISSKCTDILRADIEHIGPLNSCMQELFQNDLICWTDGTDTM